VAVHPARGILILLPETEIETWKRSGHYGTIQLKEAANVLPEFATVAASIVLKIGHEPSVSDDVGQAGNGVHDNVGLAYGGHRKPIHLARAFSVFVTAPVFGCVLPGCCRLLRLYPYFPGPGAPGYATLPAA